MENQYNNAVNEIKEAILKSQYQALKGVNRVQLSLYFGVGKYVSENTRAGKWGTGAVEEISTRLRKEMPGLKGFSAPALKKMRLFYEEWNEFFLKSFTVMNDLELQNSTIETNGLQIMQKYAAMNAEQFPMDEFLQIPFTHHYSIISKVKKIDERIFYIRLCAKEHMSVEALNRAIQNDEYSHRGAMPNNFSASLSSAEQAKRAVLSFKDEYMLDFINVEELGARDLEDVDERVVEQTIVHNIKNFIMTFGRDFAFLGNQYHIEAMGHDHYIDLLFYNRELASLVAIELKTGAFKPIYLGELNTYLQVLDDFVRKPMCKSADKAYAEYAVRDYSKPMGVATYKTASDMPERLRKALPDLEELKKLLQGEHGNE